MELAESSAQELTLREHLQILRRRKWAVLYTFGLVLTIGAIATSIKTPIFRADAKLLVRAASPYVNRLDSENPLVDLLALAQPETVETQIEVLASGPFQERVRKRAGVALPGKGGAGIRASRVQDTNVIDVAVESADPRVARDVANATVAEYLDYTREVSLTEIKAAKRFVESERARAKQALDSAEQALLEFRETHRIAQLTAEQENRLREFVDLETRSEGNAGAISRVAAQLDRVKAQLAQEPDVNHLPTGHPNGTPEILRSKLAELAGQRAAILAEYREHTPQVATIDAQIAEVKAALAAEPVERVAPLTATNPARQELRGRLRELERDLQGLKAERVQLAGQLAGKQERLNQLGPWEIRLGQLTRVRDASQKSFQTLDEKLQDLSIREHARRSDARIIEGAYLPGAPVRPRKTTNLVLAAVMGLILGISVAFLQEFMDDRVTTSEDVDRTLALPVLGQVPLIPAQQNPVMTELPSHSPIAESYRALRTSISFSGIDQPLRTLLISSALKAEGKSLTAMNLAIAIALERRRVILVDTDLRRPTVHGLLGWESGPGLTEVLLGTVELSEALREVPAVPGLRVLTSGPIPPNPAELVNSVPMEELIRRLADEADLVIFDAPPVLPVTDAALLSARVDGVLLVADVSQARRAGLKAAKEQFERARARILGVVFNKVSSSEGAYYYYTYYHRDADGTGGALGNGHANGKVSGSERRRALTARSERKEEAEEW